MTIDRITHRPEMHRDVAWKTPCRVATTANVAIATALNAGDTVDGVELADGDRVLVKDQSAGAQNGIYVAGATPARAYDMDQDAGATVPGTEVLGAMVLVIAGTSNGGKVFRCTNTAAVTLGTTAIAFTEFAPGAAPVTPVDHGSMGSAETLDVEASTAHFGILDNDVSITAVGFVEDEFLVAYFDSIQDDTGGHAITWVNVDFGGADDQPAQGADLATSWVVWAYAGDATIRGAKVGGGAGAGEAVAASHILLADDRATPFDFTDLLQMDDGSDFMWSDPE